ncbi:MAG: KOW domain-containing RNA-binding protein [Clostridia bacterium]|nr:KOW domain-containing RNA-binding protein [Clostridia bacterium]
MKQNIHIGELVQSIAGHDKGDYFLVIRREGEYLYLCDGKRRKATSCKKKKQKHMIGSGRVCPWVETQPERVNNTSVKAAIRQLLAEEA